MNITRWTPHTVARFAVAGVALIVISLAPGATSSARERAANTTVSSASERAANTTVSYACSFPSGTQQIPVRIKGTFPRLGTVGRPIRPGRMRITPTLSRAALADLAKLDATKVTASASLSVTVAQNGASTMVAWRGLAAPSTAIPDSGGLPLPASGAVPPAMAEKPGAAVFVAGPLMLVLRPHKADGGATDPAAVQVGCTTLPGPSAVLAVVTVAGLNLPVTPPQTPVTPPPGSGGAKTAPRTVLPQPADTPPCVQVVDNPPPTGSTPGEVFLAGFSNVNKLNGATLLGRENGQTTGHANVVLVFGLIINQCDPNKTIFDILSRADLDDNGKPQLPPAKATFLTFGFVPTTATIDIIQAPGTDLEIDTTTFFDPDTQTFVEDTTVTSQLIIHIHDVRVNRVPLNVGQHCRTVTPMAVTLAGRVVDPNNPNNPDNYTVNTGGPLTGTTTIPPFTGCGVGENLDPLLTASISGPGNFMKLIQGVPCTRPPDQPELNCDPIDRPVPRT